MKNFTRAGLFAGAIVLSTLGSASLHSSTASVEAKTYLLKVSNVMEVVRLVESVGGSVTDTAASINYLGASLTDDQLKLLSRSNLVMRISEETASADDAFGENESVAGFWWGGKGATVAGFWWGK